MKMKPFRVCASMICKRFGNGPICSRNSHDLGNKGYTETRSDNIVEHMHFINFKDKIEKRRNEAEKSVVVQVQSEKSAADLYDYCSQYGKIETVHHYCLSEKSHFILVEFESVATLQTLLSKCCHLTESHVIPTRTPFLWFRSMPNRKNHIKSSSLPIVPLQHQYGTAAPTDNELRGLLQTATSLSDQMFVLYRTTHLNDLGERLRFMTARQIELALCGSFPNIKALPFGSSVNGFGRMGCDLDIVLQLDAKGPDENLDDCRLVFHAKTSADGRASSQRLMETVGDMCHLFLPGISGVKRILQARVPIVKFQQDFTGIDCDLSVYNSFAVQMSELLYIMGSHDVRVRPLVFTVRAWARHVGLTNPVPGRWITNFSLVLLVLYFLQQRSPPILPSLEKLNAFYKDNMLNLDLSKVPINKKPVMDHESTTSVGMLFIEFLTFYSSFDFSSLAVNLLTSARTIKPEHSPLYIVNPLEPGLNVSKNVSPEEVEKFRVELRNGMWLLESATDAPDKEVSWGLLALFKENGSVKEKKSLTHVTRRRRVSIGKLFLEETR